MAKTIYFPSKEDLELLDGVIKNKVKIYDYLAIKIFEYILWQGYKSNDLMGVLENVIESLNQFQDVVLKNEIRTALIKLYPEALINMQCLKNQDEIQLALSMISNDKPQITDLSFLCCDSELSFLSFCLTKLKDNLEKNPLYRFEYRKDNDTNNELLLDRIFSLNISPSSLKSINVDTLKCLLYIDPMYVIKISDEDYKKIYENSGYNVEDIEYIKRRDTILAIYDYIERYKITGNIWLRNQDKNLNAENFGKTMKLFLNLKDNN